MIFGVISDTHGYFDERLRYVFAGVSHIFHCGDVGTPDVLLALETIAPVTAVRGNTDSSYLDLPVSRTFEIENLRFFIQHIVNPLALEPELKAVLLDYGPTAVLFGHSHSPFLQQIDQTWFVNPGYAGRPKNTAERSVALLRFEAGRLVPEIIRLKHCVM